MKKRKLWIALLAALAVGAAAFAIFCNITSIAIRKGTVKIDDLAYYENRLITSVTIPDSVTEIGEKAFSGCSRLKRITIPDSVVKIGKGAFSNCDALAEITLPAHLTTIDADTFRRCSALQEIEIPDGVTRIESHAFYSCDALSKITIPNSVIYIRENAFSECKKLAEIMIPDSVVRIGDSAFSGCEKLAGITIPDSVDESGAYAFSGTALLSGDGSVFQVPDDSTEATVTRGSIPEGSKVVPLFIPKYRPENRYLSGLYCLMPSSVRTMDCNEADYALIRRIRKEQRDDYVWVDAASGRKTSTARVCNIITEIWLCGRDGSSVLVSSIKDEPSSEMVTTGWHWDRRTKTNVRQEKLKLTEAEEARLSESWVQIRYLFMDI